MSEEEIIKIIKEYLSKIYTECTKVGAVGIPNEEWYAIQGLLDLYNKEKEKNEELKEKYSKKLIELQKEREKSEHLLDEGIVTYFDDDELKESVGNYLGVLLKKNIEKDYISKDKIREKIKEINNEKLNYSDDEYYLENEMKGYAIDKLKELLEEE